MIITSCLPGKWPFYYLNRAEKCSAHLKKIVKLTGLVRRGGEYIAIWRGLSKAAEINISIYFEDAYY